MKLNKERCIVASVWMEHCKSIEIYEGVGGPLKGCMNSFIKERKDKMKYLEKKYPWLKGIVKILSSKTPCQIGKYEL
jgi:hypothetical protein